MAEYIEVEEARQMSGLRLVLIAGVPSPWGEAAKGIFHVKQIPFVRVRHSLDGANAAAPLLFEHRDEVYRDYLELPIEL